MLIRAILSIAITLATLLPAIAIDANGAAETFSERARNAMNGCSSRPSQADVSRCYNEVARRFAIELKRAIEDDTDASHDPRMLTALKKSNTLWGAIIANDCDGIAKLQMEGGSGQGIHQQRCEIMVLAARLDVLGKEPK